MSIHDWSRVEAILFDNLQLSWGTDKRGHRQTKGTKGDIKDKRERQKGTKGDITNIAKTKGKAKGERQKGT
jgi:hypothetical protein